MPPDVILFKEYDPSVDMDEKMTRDSSLQNAKKLLCSDDDDDALEDSLPAKVARVQPTVPSESTRLVTPPSSPSSPPFEYDPAAARYDNTALRDLPHGVVIYGNYAYI